MGCLRAGGARDVHSHLDGRLHAGVHRDDVRGVAAERTCVGLADRGRPAGALDDALPPGATARMARAPHDRRARRRLLADRRRCCGRADARHAHPSWIVGVRVSLIAEHLDEGRRRTLDLLAPFDDTFLEAQHSPIMSPLVWDLAHVGNYEDLWLVRALGGRAVAPQHDDLYDAFRHPRADRPSLSLLSPAAARSYITEVRDE